MTDEMPRREFVRLLCAFVVAILARVPLRKVLAAYREQMRRADEAHIVALIREQARLAMRALGEQVSRYILGETSAYA